MAIPTSYSIERQLSGFWNSVRQTLLPLLSWGSEPGFCVEIITTYGNSQRGQEASWMCVWGSDLVGGKRHIYLQPNSLGVWVCVQHCRPGRLIIRKGGNDFIQHLRPVLIYRHLLSYPVDLSKHTGQITAWKEMPTHPTRTSHSLLFVSGSNQYKYTHLFSLRKLPAR